MSRRKQANRAEAVVRAVGALVLLLILFLMVQMLPNILKGQKPEEMIHTTLKMVMALTALAGLITVIGLFVWWKVRSAKHTRLRDQARPHRHNIRLNT